MRPESVTDSTNEELDDFEEVRKIKGVRVSKCQREEFRIPAFVSQQRDFGRGMQ